MYFSEVHSKDATAHLVNAGIQRTLLVADSSTDRVQTVPARTLVCDRPRIGLH